jgi:tellurite resistance protein TerC
MDKPLSMWILFFVIVLFLLVLDLGVLHRKEREIGFRESMIMSLFYIIIGLSFGAWVWESLGPTSGKEYITGYLVEKTLAMDNIFVISLIFTYFNVPRQYQHRVLFWGILGVILLRGIAIGAGAALVARFEWVLLIFAAFLIVTGIKIIISSDDEAPDLSKNKLLIWLRKHLPITQDLHGNKFSVLLPHAQNPNRKVRYYTPLFLALILVETADLIFAVDSIPAIFAITTDPYIVYTSNIFAILGLRAMYFALSAILHRFEYLKYALALILIFIGGKVFVAEWLGLEKVPASISLGVTIALLAGGMIFSVLKTSKEEKAEREKQS